LVANDPIFLAARIQLAILAARYALPAIYPFREQAEAGGLLSYGPDLVDRDRQVGRYVVGFSKARSQPICRSSSRANLSSSSICKPPRQSN
jgi:hypothetical protein